MQSVTCLTTNAYLTADPGHEFDPDPVPYFHAIDHEIISMVVLLASSDSLRKDCCQLQAEVCT